MAAIPLSLVIGSPIAGWILGHGWFAVEGWRWLFVLEGMPALLLGIVALFFLTDWPSDAAWRAPDQQQWITQKLEEEKPSNRHSVSVVQTLRSHTVLLLAGAAFSSLRGLRDYFLASNYSETPVGTFRHEGRNAGCDPICCGVPRLAV
jgi:MFS transporter, ACS family, tartrate transporter